MKIYTRRGDGGETGLFGGGRVPKDDARVEAYGTVDELNAVIGTAETHVQDGATRARLRLLQGDLFALGARLATPPPRSGRRAPALPDLPVERIAKMEAWIDAADAVAGSVRHFVLPAGTAGASRLHHARAVCRRAERRVVTLAAKSAVDAGAVRYLNRLSDYLFAAARLENHRAGKGDAAWRAGE